MVENGRESISAITLSSPGMYWTTKSYSESRSCHLFSFLLARILGGDCTWLPGGGGITFDVKGILKDEEAEGRPRTEEVDVALSSKPPPTRGEVESC